MIREFLKDNESIAFGKKYLIVMKNKVLYNSITLREKKIKNEYKKIFGEEIDFEKKLTKFTEKIQYRKLFENNILYSECSDKYLVRKYVANKIGKEYLIPLYLVTNKLTKIEWEKLPNSFVIKCNHDCGSTKIIKNKNLIPEKEKNSIIKKLNNSIKIDFGFLTLEKHYSNISRKIIAEKMLLTAQGNIPEDYKFHCFKEKIFIQVIQRKNKKLKMNYFDEDWNILNFETGGELLFDVKKPENLDKMIELARKLSDDFEYVRVDFYNLEGKIYFGELTFTPFNGVEKFTPNKWDYIFGSYWK